MIRSCPAHRPLGIAIACLLAASPVGAGQRQAGGVRTTHHCTAAVGQGRYVRSLAIYEIPELTLTNQDGVRVSLSSVLEAPGPIALNFIFTTCTTICPVMTAAFAQMQRALGPAGADLRMVSVSIDPEYDTPGVLKDYAAKFGAAGNWQFLTGDSSQIARVQKAFDAYTRNKTNHRPLSLFKKPNSAEWVRIDGLASGADLASEYRRLLAQ